MRYEAGASAGKTRLINHLHGFNLSPCCTRKKKQKKNWNRTEVLR